MISQSDLKRIRSLKHKKGRQEHGQFLIEGRRLVKAYLESQAEIVNVYYTESFKHHHQNFISFSRDTGHEPALINEKLLNQLSDTISPSGIIGVCKIIKPSTLIFSALNWIYLHQLSDPGNIGSLLRTAAWFNIRNIAFSPYSIDPFNPKVVRSAMGAHVHLEIHKNVDFSLFPENDYLTIGADQYGKIAIDQFDSTQKWVLVLGGEAQGIEPAIKQKLDKIISIPRTGYGESLNVGSAGAILMNRLSKK